MLDTYVRADRTSYGVCRSTDSDGGGKPHELRKRAHTHFLHDTRTVNLDRFHNGTQLRGDLLIQAARDDAREHLPLTGSERFKPLDYRMTTRAPRTLLGIDAQPLIDR